MWGDQELHVQTDGSKGTGLAEPVDSVLAPGLGAGIARGAAIIAGLTILSRLLGLVRTLVFSQTVGAGCLGTAYVTANQVPNLLYELVLGGALTSAMVPVLARSAERAASDPAEKARVGVITSALLTWTVIIVVPLVVVIAAAAGPIASLLNPANAHARCVRADVVAATGNMLVVFAPQALLYGLSVVLYRLLQSYRRFAAPSIGPGISNLVLIACYLAFVPLNKGRPLAGLPITAELVLSAGTTLGIAERGPRGRAADVAAAPAVAACPAVPARGGAPGGRPGARRLRRARRHRAGQCRGHRPGQRARGDRRDRLVQLRLAGVYLRIRGPGPVHRHQRVPRPVRACGAGVRPD